MDEPQEITTRSNPHEAQSRNIFHETADTLYLNLLHVKENFGRLHVIIPSSRTSEGAKIKSALAKLDNSADFSHPQSGYSPERRIRDVTDTLTFLAHHFTAEIPQLFADYQVGPKFNGTDYFPESNVQGFSTRTEGAILYALNIANQGKSVPNSWEQLVAFAEHGEKAVYNPPKFTLPDIPTVIEGKFKRDQ